MFAHFTIVFFSAPSVLAAWGCKKHYIPEFSENFHLLFGIAADRCLAVIWGDENHPVLGSVNTFRLMRLFQHNFRQLSY